MRPDLLQKLPLLLSSTCCSSDVEAVTQHSHKAIQLYHQRRDTAAANRQVLMDDKRALVEHHLGALPRTKSLKELTAIVYQRSQRAYSCLSRATIRRHLSEILYK